MVPDPGDPKSLNRYAYALGNPVRYTDPTGHRECEYACNDEPVYDKTKFDVPDWDQSVSDSLTPAQRASAARAYLHFLRDPGHFAEHYANNAFDREYTSFETFTEYSQLRMGGDNLVVGTWGAGYGQDAAQALHASNVASLVSGAGAAGAAARGGTYKLVDPETGAVMRIGRTNDLARRAGEHGRNPATEDLRFDVDWRTDNKAVQRGREQMLHDQYDPPLDRIRPISPSNGNIEKYMRAALDFGRDLGLW